MLCKFLCYGRPIKTYLAWVEEHELFMTVQYLKQHYGPMCYMKDDVKINNNSDKEDQLFNSAVETVLQVNNASVSILMRRLEVDYTRAAQLIDKMENEGIIGPFEGSKPRRVLITQDEWLKRKTV